MTKLELELSLVKRKKSTLKIKMCQFGVHLIKEKFNTIPLEPFQVWALRPSFRGGLKGVPRYMDVLGPFYVTIKCMHLKESISEHQDEKF